MRLNRTSSSKGKRLHLLERMVLKTDKVNLKTGEEGTRKPNE